MKKLFISLYAFFLILIMLQCLRSKWKRKGQISNFEHVQIYRCNEKMYHKR